MKKIIYLLLTTVLLAGMLFLTSCAGKESKLICGVTEYEPMNFRDAAGKWTGFDTEFAMLVGEKLGLKVEFQLINWGNKFIELEAKNIDAIWNGFTANTDESDGTPRMELCDMSYSYMTNTQSVVIKAERADEFKTLENLAGKTIAVEAGSAGEAAVKNFISDNGKIIGATAQIDTFMEVKSGASDGAVIDIILAKQITGSGDFSDLIIADLSLPSEVYAIGFRKGDTLRDDVNQAILELYADGVLQELAVKYGLEDKFTIDTHFGCNEDHDH